MKAVKIIEPGKVEIVETDIPVCSKGEILLKIKYLGLCGSDLNSFRGENPMVTFPRIPGHEIFGIIEELGSDVPEVFNKGQKVTVIPYTHCGKCSACRKGRYNACKNNQTLGVQRDGALCEFLSVPWEKVIFSDILSPEKLVLVEPLTVGFHAVRRAKLKAKETVMVLGCGMIGLGAIAASVQENAKVIAVDIDENKLLVSDKIGASYTINSEKNNLHKNIREITKGHGPDVIIEAVGSPETYITAINEIGFTGRVVCVGYTSEMISFATKLFVQKEIDILGSRNASPSNFRSVVKYLEQIDYNINELISHIINMNEVPEVMQVWAEKPSEIRKIIVDLDK